MSKPLKRCVDCQLVKPVQQFGRLKAAKDGFQPRCRMCKLAAKRVKREAA